MLKKTRAVRTVKSTAFYAFLIIAAFIYFIPLFFMLFTSLKSPAELFSADATLFSFPKKIMWENFPQAWQAGKLYIYMKNSALITIIRVPITLVIVSLSAYALTRLQFKPANLVFLIFLIGMMMPLQIFLVPLMIMIKKAKLFNTYWAVIVPYIALDIPLGVLVFRGFFRTIPLELDSSAKIDGCNSFMIYSRIIMPLSKPAIATMTILFSLNTWNEFLLASLFIPKDKIRTLPLGLLSYVGEWTTDYPRFMAAVLMSIIPVFVVYLFFQRYFVQGLTGTLKE
ncbi:MAG TPA: carbohydrate ABC transporter permease [archaeon]|nr:carbohydrate ABC transporter permease [archaeon]